MLLFFGMEKRTHIFPLWPLAALLCCLPGLGHAQMEPFAFRHLDKKQGLSSDRVNAIRQGPNGYLWFGTADGLDRFDGQRVKAYHSNLRDTTSISPGEILSMATSPDHAFFIGTREGVLNQYLPRKDCFRRFPVPTDKSVSHGSIWDMAFDGDSLVWLAMERGLARFDRRTSGFRLWRPSEVSPGLRSVWNDVLYSVATDPHEPGRLWVGSRGGVLFFSKKKQSFRAPFDAALSGAFLAAKGFVFENDSLVWIAGNQASVIRLSRKNWEWEAHIPEPRTGYSNRFLEKNKTGQWWTGCPQRGLGLFDPQEMRTEYFPKKTKPRQASPSTSATCAFTDAQDRLWVGTTEGVFWGDPSRQLLRHFEPEDFGKRTSGGNTVYSGTELSGEASKMLVSVGGPLLVFDKNKTAPPENVPTPPGKEKLKIWHLAKDGRGQTWAATNSGIFLFDEKKRQLAQPAFFRGTPLEGQSFFEIKKGHAGNMYALSNSLPEVLRFSEKNKTVRVFNHEKDGGKGFPKIEEVAGMAIGPGGMVWFFSESTLFRFDPEKGLFKTFGCRDCDPGPLTGRWIVSGEVDHRGRVWVGYNSGGLDCLDPAIGELRNFRLADGLPGEHVKNMALENDRALWLATNNGLSRLDLSSLQFLNFSEKDGLLKSPSPYPWFRDLKILNKEELFLSGQDYFSIFDLREIERERLPPPVRFDEILVFDQKKNGPEALDFLPKIKLGPEENFFTLTFAALEFAHPERIEYRYRLEADGFFTKNYDSEWRHTSEGKAVYTKVPPGKYVFRVDARLPGGKWGGGGRRLPIEVAPPFYRTWWFLLACFAAAAVLFWQTYRWRIGQVREKARIRQQLAEMELKALRAQMNPHFLFNSLNSIKNYIVKNEPRTAARYLTKFSRLMRLILSNSKDPTVTLADELRALELYVELESLRFRQQFGYRFEVDKNLHLEGIEIPPLVLQPYVENAIWHGLMHKKSGGYLWVRVFRKNGSLRVEVEDNGIGRQRAKEMRSKSAIRQKPMGMQITSDRLSLLKNGRGESSSVIINDLVDAHGEAAGTLVSIKIPLDHEQE